MSQPCQKKGKQSPAETAKVAARENMSDKLWKKCENGLLVTQKELTRLIKMGADIEWKDPQDFTCLFVAAYGGHLRTVQLLLSAGVNKEAKTQGLTPLWVAAQEGHIAVVNALLAAGADKEATTNIGATPLFIAVQGRHGDGVKTLLAAGVNPNVKCGSYGMTALYLAAQIGHLVIVDALLAAGADKNAKLNNETTPLVTAAHNGNISIVRALLASGADTDALDNDRSTALMRAAQAGHASCVRALLTHGCNVDAVNSRGNTALLCATHNNHSDCIRLLMRKGGADTSITSAQMSGKTPLEHAIAKGDADAETIRELRRVCGACGTTPDKNKGKFNKCGACQAMYYCSVECQRVDWPKHKGECEQMKATAEKATKAAAAVAAEKAASHTPVVPCCLACSKTSG
jgi:ankyrin repeat protein